MTENKIKRELTFKEAITEALMQEMERDPKVFLMGEDLQVFYGGGPFGVTPAEKFVKKFGAERSSNPLGENTPLTWRYFLELW